MAKVKVVITEEHLVRARAAIKQDDKHRASCCLVAQALKDAVGPDACCIARVGWVSRESGIAFNLPRPVGEYVHWFDGGGAASNELPSCRLPLPYEFEVDVPDTEVSK